jgi:hypothetical protein
MEFNVAQRRKSDHATYSWFILSQNSSILYIMQTMQLDVLYGKKTVAQYAVV